MLVSYSSVPAGFSWPASLERLEVFRSDIVLSETPFPLPSQSLYARCNNIRLPGRSVSRFCETSHDLYALLGGKQEIRLE